MKTIYHIKATPNRSRRTFTIRSLENGKTVAKYRTLPLPADEFEDMEYNTENDWRNFLRTNQNYFVV